ncbi:hypothetical protein BKA69DRAFT_138938 [Paraphysoderma sedebokerense]|nr:hypothetical protein BKA69DRAFT_138938 [Paraphysoderma sedebokerense]
MQDHQLSTRKPSLSIHQSHAPSLNSTSSPPNSPTTSSHPSSDPIPAFKGKNSLSNQQFSSFPSSPLLLHSRVSRPHIALRKAPLYTSLWKKSRRAVAQHSYKVKRKRLEKSSKEWRREGEKYLFGIDGVERKNEKYAVECFRKSAESGCTMSLALIGFCYEFGLGVPQSFKMSEYYYLLSAQPQNTEPQAFTPSPIDTTNYPSPVSSPCASPAPSFATELDIPTIHPELAPSTVLLSASISLSNMSIDSNSSSSSSSSASTSSSLSASSSSTNTASQVTPHSKPNGLAMLRLAFLRRYGRPNVRMDRGEASLWTARVTELQAATRAKMSTLLKSTTTNQKLRDSAEEIDVISLPKEQIPQAVWDELREEGSVGWLKWASEVVGDAASQYSLGTCYHDGVAVQRSPTMAVHYYTLSALQQHPRGYGILGYCHGEGFGLPRNPTLALKYYLLAANLGETVAMYNVGYCFEEGIGVGKSYEEAFSWYLKAAELGNALAANSLGYFYEEGLGVEKNEGKAVEWYRRAAEWGNPWAEHNLGWCYAGGVGVDKDEKEAVKWYKRAAEQGHAGAQNKLAYFLQLGIGTTPNPIESVYWYTKAAEQGYTSACINLAWCYENGCGCERDLRKAVMWLTKAIGDNENGEDRSTSQTTSESMLNEWLSLLIMRCCVWEHCQRMTTTVELPSGQTVEVVEGAALCA